MLTLSFPIGELRAAALFSSNDETRYTLNSVQLRIDANRTVSFVATDGRRLVFIRSRGDIVTMEPEIQLPLAVTIPLRLVKAARPTKGKSRQPHNRLAMMTLAPFTENILSTPDAQRYRITFDDGEFSITGKSIDGAFPNVASVVPTGAFEWKEGAISVRGSFLADCDQAGKLLSESRDAAPGLLIASRGIDQPVLVRFHEHDRFFAIIMPLRQPTPVLGSMFATPTWILETCGKNGGAS